METVRQTHRKYKMRRLLIFLILILVPIVGAFFLFNKERTIEFNDIDGNVSKAIFELPVVPEAVPPKPKETIKLTLKKVSDIEPQKQLANSPEVIKAIYATSWSAGTQGSINHLIDLIKTTEVNAIVIDIKDYSGYISYNTSVEEVQKYGAKEIRISKLNSLIKTLHDNRIYVIGRMAVFQDPILAKARPDLAVKNMKTGEIWADKKGLNWIDPASKEYWDYIVKIAKDAESRGFDEINFDYIRFPSDGNLNEISYPLYDDKKERKEDVIAEFFRYLRYNLKGEKISADLFGLSTVNYDDLGIGQIIENAYVSFDYVCPMVYPSHYAAGFLGYKNPADYPYEVVKYSIDKAQARLTSTTRPVTAKLRPWLQDFNLGGTYGPKEVRAQIKALEDAGVTDGWMLWDPKNIYTKGALNAE